jgi:hypothetical protein
MAYRDRAFFPIGINTYVPAMAMADGMVEGQPTLFSLGTPAAVSANSIAAAVAANAVAATIANLATPFVMDSPYGRSLRLTPSGDPGNAASVDVFGDDYLGQPMVERFTGASGATAILYGRKAFFRVRGTKIVVAATNAVTWAVGTGFRLGLPFKCDVEWAREAGVLVPLTKRDIEFPVDRAAATAIAGNSSYVIPQFPGFVKDVFGFAGAGGGGANPVLTVKLATVAIVGLTATFVDATPGVIVRGVPTTAGYNANNRFVAGSPIEIAAAAAAAAVTDRVGVTLTPTQFSLPDTTDPATTVTGDPRGTYEAITTYDGVKKIEVSLLGDNAVNAAGNGGFLGIKHIPVA